MAVQVSRDRSWGEQDNARRHYTRRMLPSGIFIYIKLELTSLSGTATRERQHGGGICGSNEEMGTK